MASEYGFYLQVASNATVTFGNALENDCLIYTESNTQRIFVGNSNNSILVSSNAVQMDGDVLVNNSIIMKGLEITVNNGQSANVITNSLTGYSNISTGTRFSIDSNSYQFRWLAGTTATEVMKLTGGGNLTLSNSISLSNGQLRFRSSNYSSFWQIDTSNTYLLVTNSNDPDGTSNAIRPITIVNSTGCMGIGSSVGYVGTTQPGAGTIYYPLTVFGSSNTGSISYRLLSYDVVNGASNGSGRDGSGWGIWTERTILCLEADAYSDRRMKTNINYLNDTETLAKVNRLKPCDFAYIDKIDKGDHTNTGFIAQEVEAIFPSVVRKTKGFVPNVFMSGKIRSMHPGTYDIILNKTDIDVKVGDMLKIAADEAILFCEVLDLRCDATSTTLTIKHDGHIPSESVFVIGKEVDDYRVLHNEGLTTVAVCAIKALKRKIQDLEKQLQQYM